MLEISALVLILQIEFNAALNYRGYNHNPLIPTSRFIRYGASRRFFNPNSYLSLASRRSPLSESGESESEETSLEDTSFRRVFPFQSHPYLRQNNYLRYDSRADNDVSLEMSPLGRLDSVDYADSYESAPPQWNRADSNFRQPYLRSFPPNLRQLQKRRYHRKGENDISLDLSSTDRSSSGEYNVDSSASRSNEFTDPPYVKSLLSLVNLPNNRQQKPIRQYRRKGDNNLNIDISSVDESVSGYDTQQSLQTSQATSLEDISLINSLLSKLDSPKYRRLGTILEKALSRLSSDKDNSNSRRKYASNQKHVEMLPANYNPEGVLVLSVENKPDDVANRRDNDDLNLQRLNENHLNDSLKDSKEAEYSRKDDVADNVGLELFNDRMSLEDGNLSVLRLEHQDNVDLETTELSDLDQIENNYRRDDDYDDVSLALSSNDRINLDDDAALNLSDLRSNLDDLSIALPNQRNSNLYSQENSRNENDESIDFDDRLSAEEDALGNLSVLRLPSVDDLSVESLNRKKHQRSISLESDQDDFETLLSNIPYLEENDANILKLYHKATLRNRELPSNKQNERDNSDFSASDLYDVESSNLNNLRLSRLTRRLSNRQEDDDDSRLKFPSSNNRRNPENNVARLWATKPNDLNLEALNLRRSKNQNNDKDTTDQLHLEFPWNGQLSPEEDKNSYLSAFLGLRSHLISREQLSDEINPKQDNYALQLEYPWTGQLSSDRDSLNKVIFSRRNPFYDLSYERPYLRIQNRRLNNDPSLRFGHFVSPLTENQYDEDTTGLESLDSQVKDRSYPEQSDESLSENQNLEPLITAREDIENSTDLDLLRSFSSEEPNGFIALPLDRRPHQRLKTKSSGGYNPLNPNRRVNPPLATTTVRPNTTEALSTSTEGAIETGTYNDTIIFPVP